MRRRRQDEPNMSDATLLMNVEDLINIAMGPPNKNIVNYKMVQTVLHILARQMRMLETQVEIRISEISPLRVKGKKKRETESSDSSPRSPKTSPKPQDKMKGKDKSERVALKEKAKPDRDAEKVDWTASKDKDKAQRVAIKEKERADKNAEKADRAASKEREKTERATSKERDKAEKMAVKDAEKAQKAEIKEQERANKEKEKVEKAAVKDKEKGIKEQEKANKSAMKEADKTEKALTKEKEKMIKEQEKAERASSKERDKATKEQVKLDKAVAKEKERLEREQAKAELKLVKEKGKGYAPSATSIVVSEKQIEKERVLVVEKGPTTRTDSRTRLGSIEVVTLSQFELLEAAVKELKDVAGPLPTPALPDNQKLRDDLVKGTASLTDTMQAMQITARIQAAEQAIGRMADLITQLAASGAIPEALVDIVQDVKAGVEETIAAAAATGVTEMVPQLSIAPRKSVAIDTKAIDPSQTRQGDALSRKSVASRMSTVPGAQSQPSTVTTSRSMVSTRPSMVSGQVISVSHKEMDGALQSMREDLTKKMNMMTAKVAAAAETAVNTAKDASNKSEIATKLDSRITTLNSLVSDYAEQLSGFDSGLTTQMQSFQEQMAQMRSDLKGGLTLLEQANNNTETAAVTELNERYEGLVNELDITLHAHQGLTGFQKQLEDQLHSLVERVEMLQEQKADRDEVLDGLRDKADLSRLAGLLTEWDFAAARAELERRLELCHDKFKKQEMVWLGAIRDLTQITENKAEIMQLLATRDDAQQQLRDIHEKLHKLSDILGEPKAAMITRILSRGATCGACMIPALMNQTDISYGAPPPLPAIRPRPTGAPAEPEEPCLQEWTPSDPLDSRVHTCHRWVGGSHTLISDAVTRERAEPIQLQARPTKRFPGYGTDGRLYMMEEELQPCLECNIIADGPAESSHGAGDGDQGVRLSVTNQL